MKKSTSGGINKNDRAKTMSALLLSVVEEPPNLDTSLTVLIGEINTRSKDVLTRHGKPEFAPYVHILPPSNATNHVKFKDALIKTIQELHNLNIRSAMNSSTDVLGQFYEVFLKYGNGAKEIGIVLTPRHITRSGLDAMMLEVVIDPLLRPEPPRDIPGPHLVRRRGHQLGLLVLGMGALRLAFLNRHLGGQNTIHRAFAAQVDLFVEQRGHHLGG